MSKEGEIRNAKETEAHNSMDSQSFKRHWPIVTEEIYCDTNCFVIVQFSTY
jgi:hypothetical protein